MLAAIANERAKQMEIREIVIAKELAMFLDGAYPGRTAAFYWNVNLDDDSKTTLDFKERVIDNGHLKSYPAYTLSEIGEFIKANHAVFDNTPEGLPDELNMNKMEKEQIVAKTFDPNFWGSILKFAIEQKLIVPTPSV